MDGRAQRRFNRDIREIRHMSTWWSEWAAAHGVPSDTRQRAEVCLNETVANVILHNARRQIPGTIEIVVEASGDGVTMTVVDDGEAFDPVSHRPASLPSSLDDFPIGGLGIRLMRSFADDIRYRRADGRNRLTFTFTAAPNGAP